MIRVFILSLLVSSQLLEGSSLDSIFDGNVEEFMEQIVSSKNAFVVEFYSEMCGTCQEFAPTWQKLIASLSAKLYLFNAKLHFVKVKVDTDNGRALAELSGAFRDGIPSVKVYDTMGTMVQGDTIVKGAPVPLGTLERILKKKANALRRDVDGYLLKRIPREEL